MPFYCSYCHQRINVLYTIIISVWNSMSPQEWWEYCTDSQCEILVRSSYVK